MIERVRRPSADFLLTVAGLVIGFCVLLPFGFDSPWFSGGALGLCASINFLLQMVDSGGRFLSGVKHLSNGLGAWGFMLLVLELGEYNLAFGLIIAVIAAALLIAVGVSRLPARGP